VRISPSHRGERTLPVDMTPMIDIVFQLLIFFLTTAQLAQLSLAEVELPLERGEASDETAEAGLIVNILADGSVVVAGQATDLVALSLMAESLVAESAGGDRDVRPLVRADRSAPAAALNRTLSVLQRAGVGAVRIATDPGA